MSHMYDRMHYYFSIDLLRVKKNCSCTECNHQDSLLLWRSSLGKVWYGHTYSIKSVLEKSVQLLCVYMCCTLFLIHSWQYNIIIVRSAIVIDYNMLQSF